MLKFLERLITRRLNYTTRFHLKERFRSLDFKFLGAVLVLVVLTYVAMRVYR